MPMPNCPSMEQYTRRNGLRRRISPLQKRSAAQVPMTRTADRCKWLADTIIIFFQLLCLCQRNDNRFIQLLRRRPLHIQRNGPGFIIFNHKHIFKAGDTFCRHVADGFPAAMLLSLQSKFKSEIHKSSIHIPSTFTIIYSYYSLSIKCNDTR